MPVDRHRSPPVTPYQKSRRVWLDTVTALTARATVEASEHVQRAWLPLSIILTAACPRKGHIGKSTAILKPAAVEVKALDLVREHIARCTCRDDDWKWITNPKETT
ncbi:hypothetical protein [Nocardioides sp. InS609-2]|uniref:hypothetical protein n=1 Tax=Nocardioides sp. InS609-2 TaxID=2760705 RepID=UPI0020BD696F|nr:hypothetical protein [Nocardioides sp. InS609-2]